MHRPRSSLPWPSIIIIVASLTLAGCVTNGIRIDEYAQSAGLQKRVLPGVPYSHVVYEKRSASRPGTLFVFLEGDGTPWGSSGMLPATDPTTRNPLALRLMIATDASSIYVARPCYQDQADTLCSADRWTGGRYADDIVASMASVIDNESTRLQATQLVIVGYSGGGTLAVLIAERLHNVDAVVTIGANLDIAAWAEHHHYLPLAQSLNPASSALAHPWKEFHFIGGKDAIVPAATADLYFKRYPRAQRIIVDNSDHVCCWESDWQSLLERLKL
jgi:pimeloyl-ACP methyl ester carboxylesterase